jgi:hypothetical protein
MPLFGNDEKRKPKYKTHFILGLPQTAPPATNTICIANIDVLGRALPLGESKDG